MSARHDWHRQQRGLRVATFLAAEDGDFHGRWERRPRSGEDRATRWLAVAGLAWAAAAYTAMIITAVMWLR